MIPKRKKQSFGMEYIVAANCLFEANEKDLYSKLFSIPYFTISNIPVTPSDCLALGKLTALSDTIQEPRLSLCYLDNLCIKYLTCGLLEAKRTFSIHIAEPAIDEVGIKIFSELFRKGIVLQLIGCELIAAEGFLTILRTIKNIKDHMPQSIVLMWCKVEINEDNGPLLQQVMQQANFWCLSLRGNEGVGDEGAKFIANGLCGSPGLRHLDLEECNITEKGAKLISNGLKYNKTVKILKLSCNFFADEGADYIRGALENNTTIRELELNNCRFSPNGARKIWNGLEHNKSIKVLDLSHNNIGNEGAACIGKALKCNTSLEDINLSECCLTSQGARSMSIGLQDNRSVKYLNLSDNFLLDEGANFIMQALIHNKTLEVLEMTLCCMTRDGMVDFTEQLYKYSTVKQLSFFTDFERVWN